MLRAVALREGHSRRSERERVLGDGRGSISTRDSTRSTRRPSAMTSPSGHPRQGGRAHLEDLLHQAEKRLREDGIRQILCSEQHRDSRPLPRLPRRTTCLADVSSAPARRSFPFLRRQIFAARARCCRRRAASLCCPSALSTICRNLRATTRRGRSSTRATAHPTPSGSGA